MAEKSATPEDQSELNFRAGFEGDSAATVTADKPEKTEPEKTDAKPEIKAEEPPEKTEPKAEKKPAAKHVQITQEQLDRFVKAADETAAIRTEMSKAFGTFGNTIKNMQDLVKGLQEATPEGKEVKLPDDLVTELEEAGFPDLAPLIRKTLEKAFKSGVRGTGEKPATQPIKVEGEAKKPEPADAKRIAAEIQVLEDVHPDWKQIVGAVGKGEEPDPKHPFRAWLATQPESYRTLINETDDARLIERAITRFKAYEAEQKAPVVKKPDEKPAPPKPQSLARRQALADAVNPRGAGHEPPAATTTEDAFRNGYASESR